jgi:hypothetical protein
MANVDETNIMEPLEKVLTLEEAIKWFDEEGAEQRAETLLKEVEEMRAVGSVEVGDKIASNRAFIKAFKDNSDAFERSSLRDVPGGSAGMLRVRGLKERLLALIQ